MSDELNMQKEICFYENNPGRVVVESAWVSPQFCLMFLHIVCVRACVRA